VQGTYFLLVESMPGKYRTVFVIYFNYSFRMITFCYTIFCMLHICEVNRQCCETHGIVII